MLAHELRNPLAAMSGAFAISARSSAAEDLEWSRGAIDRNIKQLARLIDDLLDVSRVTRGKIELRKERFDVASVIDLAVDSIQYLLAPKGHQLGVSVARGSLWVDADAARLQQILTNLLTNAIQYSEPASYISLRAHQRNGQIVISVRDKGQGIQPDLLPHVFELFRQGDRSLARTEGGLGIGLTMVKALAEMHGGSVTASSDGPGKGSEFVVCLPSAQRRDKAHRGRPSSKDPVERRRGNRILVVDDNVDLNRALTTLLSRSGFEVRAVYDGHSAIEAARTHQPGVVLLDIGLPGMDGYEVARRLRMEEGFHDATIIAITGYGQEDGYNHSRAEGFNHHLIKPVQIESLIALLSEPGPKPADSNQH
jgi:CheY-like chemotaxis protein/two-component sensor histidine kinase